MRAYSNWGETMTMNVEAQVSDLEWKLNNATAKDRLGMHPIVQKMIERIARSGRRVPLRLSRMNTDLADEAFDAMYENMPL